MIPQRVNIKLKTTPGISPYNQNNAEVNVTLKRSKSIIFEKRLKKALRSTIILTLDYSRKYFRIAVDNKSLSSNINEINMLFNISAGY